MRVKGDEPRKKFLFRREEEGLGVVFVVVVDDDDDDAAAVRKEAVVVVLLFVRGWNVVVGPEPPLLSRSRLWLPSLEEEEEGTAALS